MSARSWCYTLNNYTLDELLTVEGIQCRYHIWGLEVSATGTPHIQGYVEFAKVMRLAGVRKLIGRAHWEVRRGTRDQARTYCQKDGEWDESGDFDAGGQGTRNDVRLICDKVRGGENMLNIMDDIPAIAARNMRFMEKYIELVEKEDTREFRKVEVAALVGDAGSGKSRIVHDLEPTVFTVNTDETFPFDGYDGEDAILIDDFYGGLKYSNLLRILDGHQYRVNVKGGHRYAKWTRVYITSNEGPESWYKRGLTPALKRRINSVTMFCNEEAGNTVPLLEIL